MRERSGGLAIDVRDLVKRYGSTTAVDEISFAVPRGDVFAFVGTNGAGKSTTIGCLTTVLPFDSGAVSVAGFDVRSSGEQVRRHIGVVFQDPLLDPLLTVRENLRLRGVLSAMSTAGIPARIESLSALMGMEDFVDQRYGTLSGGQKRRVDVARALLHEPAIVFLDEPTAGLDPAGRASVWEALQHLRASGQVTIFLTTHYLEETEEADRVCVVDRGRVVADDSPAALRARYSRSVLRVTTDDAPALLSLAARAGASAEHAGDRVELMVRDSGVARELLGSHGDHVIDFEFRHGSMDDVFLALTGLAPDRHR